MMTLSLTTSSIEEERWIIGLGEADPSSDEISLSESGHEELTSSIAYKSIIAGWVGWSASC